MRSLRKPAGAPPNWQLILLEEIRSHHRKLRQVLQALQAMQEQPPLAPAPEVARQRRRPRRPRLGAVKPAR